METIAARLYTIAAAAALAALCTGGAAHAACDAGETVIKFSHVAPTTGHPKGEAAAALAALVNDRLDGRVCLEVYPNSALYDDTQAPQALLDGKVQMIAPSFSKLEKYTLKGRVFDLPFLFRDAEALLRFQRAAAGRRLLDSMRGSGLLGLAFWNNGMKQMSADRPLLQPSDAKGLVFRVQPSEVLAAQFEALGARAKKMAFKDVHGALKSGAVNGQENTWANIATQRFFEVQDGTTETNHGAISSVLLVASDFWNGLPPQDRRDLEQIIGEVDAARGHLFADYNRQGRRHVVEAGGVVRALSEAQRAAWRQAMKPVWARFEGDIGADLIEAALAAN